MTPVVAECYFLDVGQGAAQVIDLGDGSAIVIDCGPSYPVLGDLLRRRLRIDRIAALVLSHNHSDHVGGVPGLVRQFRRAIDRIYLLQDQAAVGMEALRYFSYLRQQSEAGNVPEPALLIRHQEHRWLYTAEPPAPGVQLEVLFPGIFENIAGQVSGNQNRTCAILLLRCGRSKVLFPGDAGIDAWRRVNERREGRPVEVDVMAIPHHGGQIVRYRRRDETFDQLHAAIAVDLEWLYTKAINARVAIASVGTSNSYPDQHPLPVQIHAIRKAGSCVMCTQITNRCADDLERLRPGVLRPQYLPCRSRAATTKTAGGESSDVACAGTVLVQLSLDGVSVQRRDDHQASIDATLTTDADHPLCRH